MLRRALVATFRGIIRLYFRQIERVGEPPGPDTRGRVFVSNHHNALIDPVLVLTDAEEPLVRLPEPADAMRMSDAPSRDGVWTSRDGLIQAGPPGVIGLVGPPRGAGRSGSDGFR